MIKSFLKTAKTNQFLTSVVAPRFPFTIYSNQHQKATDTIGDKTVKYDYNLTEYDRVVQAFLEKRWTTKEELPPKIYIIDPLDEIADTLKLQRLPFMKKLYEGSRLQKMYEQEEMNSQYLMSTVFEEHFKPLLDEYFKKVLICGRVPPLEKLDQYNEIVTKCRQIYTRFFFGDPLSEFEKDVESRYLVNKQRKYLKWLGTNRPQYKCTWTYSQQRRLEMMKNYIARDLKYFDDYRPLYEPLFLEKRLDLVKLNLKLNNDSWFKRLFFHLFESSYYKRSRKRDTFVVQNLINRAMFYAMSIEFTQTLNVPPDFHIEHSILNVHIWLMADRLKKIGGIEAKFMAQQMDHQFKRLTLDKANQIHLRKKNDFINDVNHFMLNNRIAYDRHFNKNPKTSLRPYYKLDALVWSTIFFEKIPRYSDIVYLMSEYIIKHYEYLQTVELDRFLWSDIEWDVYRIPVTYKAKLQEVNPPLSEEELAEEINSDKKVKKHYYSYDDPEYELPIHAEANNIVKRRFENFHFKMFDTIRKYNSLDTYDFYTEREQKEKVVEEKKKKYPIWNVTDRSFDRFTPADDLKKKIKERKSSI